MKFVKNFFKEDITKGYLYVKHPETKEPIPYLLAVLKLVLYYFIKTSILLIIGGYTLVGTSSLPYTEILKPAHHQFKQEKLNEEKFKEESYLPIPYK